MGVGAGRMSTTTRPSDETASRPTPSRLRPAPPTGTTHPVGPWHTPALAVLLLTTTGYGLLADEAYRVSPGVRDNFGDVMRGQDVVTLLTVPVLLLLSRRAGKGSLPAHLLRNGLFLYYAYSYLLYALSPYNDVFLVNVAILGLAAYGLLVGLFRLDVAQVGEATAGVPRRGIGWFLVVIGCLFATLWLSMLLPALPGDLPAGRMTYDIPSVVHVLDLALVLPVVVGTGVLMLRDAPVAPALAVMLLCKMTTLGLSLVSMNLLFNDAPDPGETALWATITAISVLLAVRVLRQVRTPRGSWSLPSVWH